MAGLRQIFALFIPVLFLFLLTSFALQAEEKTGLLHDSIIVQKQKRTFDYYVPTSYSHDQSVPLVLAFHGRGSTAENQIKLTKFDELAEKERFIAVFPNSAAVHEPNLKKGHERQWNDGRMDTPAFRAGIDDVQFISQVIDYFTEHYNIDESRVYAAGMSNGAFFANRLAIELSDRIAGVGAVAGTLAVPIANQKPREPVSIVLIMGTDDPIVPYEGVNGYAFSAEETIDYWKKANGLNSNPSIKKLPKKDKKDTTEVIKIAFSDPTNRAEVILYKIQGGGHAWPGGPQYAKTNKIGLTSRQIHATEVIWNELKKHKKSKPISIFSR